MSLTRDRARSIGWAVILSVCLALTVILTFRVNAVKSQVRLTERQIIALKQEKLFLETEFQARASQQQLRNLNDVEFGYEAPSAAQYLEGERQLAALGKPRAADAPAPIRIASASDVTGEEGLFPAMVSPLTGKPAGASAPASSQEAGNQETGSEEARGSGPANDSHAAGKRTTTAASLGARLVHIESRKALRE